MQQHEEDVEMNHRVKNDEVAIANNASTSPAILPIEYGGCLHVRWLNKQNFNGQYSPFHLRFPRYYYRVSQTCRFKPRLSIASQAIKVAWSHMEGSTFPQPQMQPTSFWGGVGRGAFLVDLETARQLALSTSLLTRTHTLALTMVLH
jgi:hypothetical protein